MRDKILMAILVVLPMAANASSPIVTNNITPGVFTSETVIASSSGFSFQDSLIGVGGTVTVQTPLGSSSFSIGQSESSSGSLSNNLSSFTSKLDFKSYP